MVSLVIEFASITGFLCWQPHGAQLRKLHFLPLFLLCRLIYELFSATNPRMTSITPVPRPALLLTRVIFYEFSTLAIPIGGKRLGLFTDFFNLSVPLKISYLFLDRIEEAGAVGVSGSPVMAGLVPSPYFQRYRCLLRMKKTGDYDEDTAAGYSESENSDNDVNDPSDPNDPNGSLDGDASSLGTPSVLGMLAIRDGLSILA